jgi:uncharacterized membrane protein YkvA (DUF1232 family)
MNEFANPSSLTGASHLDDEEQPQTESEEIVSDQEKRPWLISRLIEAGMVLRNFVYLLIGILFDDRVDRKVKFFVASVLAYIFAPIDFIPELFSGLFGIADDFVLAAFALNVLLNWIDPQIVESHWRGKKDLLATIQKGIKNAEILVPEAILKKIQSWIGQRAPQHAIVPVQPAPVVPVETESEEPKTTRKKRTTRSRKTDQ